MIKQADRILADELVKAGIVAQDDILKCVSEVTDTDETLRSFLIRNKFASESQVLDALAKGLQLETIDLSRIEIDKSVLERIPVKFAWYYKFVPIRIENKELTLVSATSLDVKIQDEIRVHLGLEPRIVLAKESDVIEALKKHYGVAAETVDQIISRDSKKSRHEELENVWVEDLEKETEDASVSKLVNEILLDAYKKRATDIHIEPYREKVRLRYRIDGTLIDAHLPKEAKQFLRPILSRIKILANLSIEERRLPQDGSAVVKTKEQDLDLRISTIPTPRGESMVIRLLPTKVMLYSLEKLGIDKKMLELLRDLLKKPHGIILVTGPTGSGKTTTLYASLNEISSEQRKIITIEDPVEFEMEGITQIQVNAKVNLDFARGLRSVLRHDPDVIMVGEVRDLETAEIAIRTALTGHLVFSTLHTNDAASGVTRLMDMGLEPYLVASSIEAFIAQRLVRVICSSCKEKVKTPLLELREEIARVLNVKKIEDINIYRGKGCDRCNNTGFFGRTAIYEIMLITEDIREAILNKSRAEDIKIIAMKNGMKTLRQDGWLKVTAGVTTPDEVLEVTVKDQIIAPINIVKDEDQNIRGSVTIPAPVKERFQIDTKKVLAVEKEFESRVYERVDVKLDMRFQIVLKDKNDSDAYVTDGIEHATYTKDISAGGLRFTLGHNLPVDTIISLKIQLIEGERSIDCLAKICRVEEDDMLGRYNMVAYFLDLPSADRVKLENFTKNKLDIGHKKKT